VTNFSEEALLWDEMHGISKALQFECQDEKTIYLRGCVFCYSF